ncbi:transposase-like protein [Bradyrhizobium sp. LM2.7]
MVRIFPNAESCLRLVRALTAERHEALARRSSLPELDLLKEHKKEALRQAA